ncbi:MAG TPA: O-antigen ligase family protein [Luteibaculaceae bacterium]|nr:O-antigen ligase family protein [Luteibaculaceae bacterium]
MLPERKSYYFWICGAAFALLNAIAVAFEFYFAGLIPVALLFAWLAFNHYDKLVYFVVLATPLSINLDQLAIEGVGLYVPTEPILIGLMLLFLLETIRRNPIDPKIFKHPISLVIYAHLAWLAITSYLSEMPVVSYKFLTARLWFVVVMYFITTQIFKDYRAIRTFLWLYMISLCVVVGYTITIHAQNDFSAEAAHWAMTPFFNDHTSYGALLAMYFPVVLGLLIAGNYSFNGRIVLLVITLILAVGLILSYTRAAWLSLIAAAGVFVILYFRINFRFVLLGLGIAIMSFFVYKDVIIQNLEKNRQDSSENLSEHVESVSNISTDASNLERLNRWNCAWRMFLDKPVFGFGPGTYQFQYAPYQSSADRTIISTNSGDGGNAHSEYLGPLAETGLIGSLIMIILIGVVIHTAVKLYISVDRADKSKRTLIMTLLLGLITYYVHGVLNNYLDTDKASIPFWSFTAAFVAIELFHSPNSREKTQA